MDTDIGRPGADMLACIRLSKSSPCLRVFPHIFFPLYLSRPALSHQIGTASRDEGPVPAGWQLLHSKATGEEKAFRLLACVPLMRIRSRVDNRPPCSLCFVFLIMTTWMRVRFRFIRVSLLQTCERQSDMEEAYIL